MPAVVDTPNAGADQAEVIARVQQALFEALPGLQVERLVELLEFIAVQHSGSNFNPDNQDKALEIAAFCQKSSYPVSKAGVSGLARLARHALGKSDGKGNSAEHQLWLLTSGALNTAAAVAAHECDAVTCFTAIRTDGGVRGRYMQREYAKAAMREHLERPEAALRDPDAPDPDDPDAVLQARLANLKPLQLYGAGLVLCVALFLGVVLVNERGTHSLLIWLSSVRSALYGE